MVSIIVPILNEARVISSFLEHLLSLEGKPEILVIDGGSTDNSNVLAAKYARVITSEKGRAKQMNAGAREASGDVFLFLHADSRLYPYAISAIEAALADPACVGGCFHLVIDDTSLLLRLVALLSNLRVRLSGTLFGDQGIFVRRDTFERMGGFSDMELMEDWDFSHRLRSQGKIKQLPIPITTSARRWRRNGIWRTIWLMYLLKFLYLLKVPPKTLAAIYGDAR